MVAPAAGTVVLEPFPFSDLPRAKLRPALVLADAGRGHWILRQITNKAHADPRAVVLTGDDFRVGSLRATSYAHPGKLFTANRELMVAEVEILKAHCTAPRHRCGARPLQQSRSVASGSLTSAPGCEAVFRLPDHRGSAYPNPTWPKRSEALPHRPQEVG